MEMAANNNVPVESSYSNVFELSGDRELGGSERNTGQKPTAEGQATYDTVTDVQLARLLLLVALILPRRKFIRRSMRKLIISH